MYGIKELARAAEQNFGVSPALAYAALKATGKTKFELDTARKIILKFANQRVAKD